VEERIFVFFVALCFNLLVDVVSGRCLFFSIPFMPFHLVRICLGVALCVALVSGCVDSRRQATGAKSGAASGQSAQGTGDKKGVVGVSVLTSINPFFNVIGENLKAELAKGGYDTLLVSGEFDVARQQQQVRDFLVAKCAAIVLCPCDSKAIGPVIAEANAAGVPVFTADIACLAPGAKVVSHIATDNREGGRQAAQAMTEALGEAGGKVVILDYKAAESCILRVLGFKEAMEKHNSSRTNGKIEIVAELPGDGQKDKGDKAAQDALTAHPDLAGIFAINDLSALGARAALEKAGKADQVKIVGFDGQPDGKQAIKEGKIYADPIQHPDQIGIKTAQSILKYFAGEEIPPEQLIPPALYRQADALKDPELK
jgi:ribose transport system substrate-binding protein